MIIKVVNYDSNWQNDYLKEEQENQMRLISVFTPRFYRVRLIKFPLKICGIRRRL